MKLILLNKLLLLMTFSSFADGWIQKADFAGTGRENAVAFYINDKGYLGTGGSIVSSGKSFWEYDPIADTWAQKVDLAGAGRESAVGFSIGERGYIGLGQIEDCCFTDDFWEYNPVTNQWTQKASVPGGKRADAFVFTIENKAYIGGGANNSTVQDDLWQYDPATDTWTKKADYGGGHIWNAAAFAIGSKAYAGVGVDENGEYRNDFWEYDPAINTWTQRADFSGGVRSGSVGFSIGNKGYFGLGVTLDTSYADLWQYNPATNTWIQKSSYPGAGAGDRTSFALLGKGYVGTGGAAEKEFYQYTPDADCTTPSDLSASSIKSTSARVSWDVEPSAQTYSVRYRKSGTVLWTKVTAQLNYKKLTGLSPETQYDWSAKSVCDAVNNISSSWSATQNFTTKQLRQENDTDDEFIFNVFPNPVSHDQWSAATISFSVEQNAVVIIDLFDISGKKLSAIINQPMPAGRHKIPFTCSYLTSGIYFLKIQIDNSLHTEKVLLQ